MACQTELDAANTCVGSEPACSNCFDPSSFLDDFPEEAEDYFRSTLAFASPQDPEFCAEANWRVCKKFYPLENGPASCCCVPETKLYMQCMFREGGWLDTYFIADQACEYNGCSMFDLEGACIFEGSCDVVLPERKVGKISHVIVFGVMITMAVFVVDLILYRYCKRSQSKKVGETEDEEEGNNETR